METITSVHNPRVKAAARLRGARERVRQGRFLIDGMRELRHAAAAGVAIEEVFICLLDSSIAAGESLGSLPPGAALVEVSPAVFGKLAYGDRHFGVVAVAKTPAAELANLSLRHAAQAAPLVAVLAGVEKPGNVGAVFRSADASAVSAVIVADGGTDLFNPNAIRASLGTIFTVPAALAARDQTLAWLREQKLSLYAARVDAPLLYTNIDWAGPAAIILGSEAAGLSSDWNAAEVVPFRLPMCGAADSLNVSATAAVVFYEALRQRNDRSSLLS